MLGCEGASWVTNVGAVRSLKFNLKVPLVHALKLSHTDKVMLNKPLLLGVKLIIPELLIANPARAGVTLTRLKVKASFVGSISVALT
ncbi:Uncharacterised protein [uncultured archaeon]|nr:Uncharacterised protein [uncultured archaeon]